jgi:hypothetical protein
MVYDLIIPNGTGCVNGLFADQDRTKWLAPPRGGVSASGKLVAVCESEGDGQASSAHLWAWQLVQAGWFYAAGKGIDQIQAFRARGCSKQALVAIDSRQAHGQPSPTKID